MKYVIETKNLTRTYGKLVAVNNLNLALEGGLCFGYLGPNGAGKTTTIKMLAGFLKPTSGSVRIFGYDVPKEGKKAKQYMGMVPDFCGFYEDLSALDHLNYYAELKGMQRNERVKRIDELLEFVGLEERKDSNVGEFSQGMKQRLAIAQALLGKPRLLLLDEPTSNLDPEGQYEFKKLLKKLTATNELTIFLSSHRLGEVEEFCTTVGILNKGVLLRVEEIKKLQGELKEVAGTFVEIVVGNLNDGITESVRRLDGVLELSTCGENTLRCRIEESGVTSRITRKIVELGGDIRKVSEPEPSLEEIFMKFVK
ncbi:MAG: ATP-binding cassette domain-containing protein [Dehalococcoidia bacterium]|nr:putative ABC transporter ATP-binding protein YxlF [Chloroflexota bacterium]MBT9162265.1 putative ABC transporter ATP-binding protein YxlF [Chloroflexota bacterium]